MEFTTRVVSDNSHFAVVMISGFTDVDIRHPLEIFDVSVLTPAPKKIRVENTVWTVQDKMNFLFWWEREEKKESLMFPLEGRMHLSFRRKLESPEGWSGKLWVTTRNVIERKHFMVIIDLDKVL